MNEKSNAADTFDELFSDFVKELKIVRDSNLLNGIIKETDPVLEKIKKCKNYPSTLQIKILFKYFNVEYIKREINNRNNKKNDTKR